MTIGEIIVRGNKTPNDFAAITTETQFLAIARKISSGKQIEELILMPRFIKAKKASTFELDKTKKWLTNAWNTELVLRANEIIIDEIDDPFLIQWAIPQAYYSIYCSLMALHNVLGFSQTSHTAVRKKYAEIIQENYIPESIGFYCTGYTETFDYFNIKNPAQSIKPTRIDDFRNEENLDSVICQLLRSTRKHYVEEHKEAAVLKRLGIVNKNSQQPKKKLTKVDWKLLESKCHPTTLLDFLYRKRIKANYNDIEVFSSERLNAKLFLNSLIVIVDKLNLIHEAYIYKSLRKEEYKSIKDKFVSGSKGYREHIENRYKTLSGIIC